MIWPLILVLVLTLIPAVWRVIHGPSRADRLVAIQLFGTIGTAVLLLLAQSEQLPSLRDVALVIALLAAMVSAALVQFLRSESRSVTPADQEPAKPSEPLEREQ